MPGPQGFPREERLTRRSEYLHVYEHGRKRVGKAFICYTARQAGPNRKVGFSVSRKVGTAVVRNRIKRYLREIYRTHRAHVAEGTHIVVVARPPSATLGYHECERAMRKLLCRTGDAIGG